jgi:hypothetical protein
MGRRQTETLWQPEKESMGTVERAAAKDLRELRQLGMMTTATEALAAAYRRAARDVDRADRSRDVWAATAAMRELRSLRLELAPTASPLAGDSLSELLDQITDVVERSRERTV